MDVKINDGDTIQIPEGCKAVIKDNVVVFEKEKENFKDGDILHATTTDGMTILEIIVMFTMKSSLVITMI